MRTFILCLLALLLAVLPSSAMVWVERTVPEKVSAEAVAKVEQAAFNLRSLLASCEKCLLSLPDEPGEDCSSLLATLDEAWNTYVRTMHQWGYIDDSREWMKPYWRPRVCLYGKWYAFDGLHLPEQRTVPKLLLKVIISLMRKELEDSQQEHLDCVRRLQEAQQPAPWELEGQPSPYELPPLLLP